MVAIAGAVAAVAGAGANVYSASKSGNQQTSSQQQSLDPRAQNMLYGNAGTLKAGAQPTGINPDGSPYYPDSAYEGRNLGFLPQAEAFIKKPQNAGMQLAGQAYDNYVGAYTPWDLAQQRQAALGLTNSAGLAHQMEAAQGGYTSPFGVAQSSFPGGNQGPSTARSNTATASLINGPSQNDINLNPVYSNFLTGDLGNNPYLAGSIQKGLNQSNANFQNLQNDAMQQFREEILPALRGDAIVNGQYGGSRQGIAEGKAADSLARNMTRALSQVGQNQTDAAVQAQAGAYDQDRSRQLSALSGLSGNQYNVAGQDAGFKNQVELSNAQMLNNMGQFNAGVGNNYLAQLLQNEQFNAGAKNANNAMQYQGNQQMNLANLNNKQSANLTNVGALFNMDQLNSQNKATGAGLLGALTNNNFNMAAQQNDYGLNQMGKVSNLMSPYIGMGQTTTSSQPLYQNQGANALGGAMMGAELFKQFGSNFGGAGTSNATRNPNIDWSPSTTYNVPNISGILNP